MAFIVFSLDLCVPFAVLEWEGETLELTRISRLDMGAYLCIASNGVPPSVSKRIKVSVDCKYYGFSMDARSVCHLIDYFTPKLRKNDDEAQLSLGFLKALFAFPGDKRGHGKGLRWRRNEVPFVHVPISLNKHVKRFDGSTKLNKKSIRLIEGSRE